MIEPLTREECISLALWDCRNPHRLILHSTQSNRDLITPTMLAWIGEITDLARQIKPITPKKYKIDFGRFLGIFPIEQFLNENGLIEWTFSIDRAPQSFVLGKIEPGQKNEIGKQT